MFKAEIDLSILIIFFARPNTLKEVFEKVKEARPTKLFLFCDGPRNERDTERIAQSKEIVEDIDWDCEVHRYYSKENLGCGRGPSTAISWAFQHTERLLILEDDCVPNSTLFPYMKEMLDRYEEDKRIGIISGFNHFKEWDTGGDSYCFTKAGATLGWGTWKRVWDCFDYNVEGIKDKHTQKLLKGDIINSRVAKNRCRDWVEASKETKIKKVNYWDRQFGFVKYTQSFLCIVPKGNLIYNNGVGEGSTHTEKTAYQKWKPGQVLFMPTVDMEFPLKHPKYVICDREYDEKYFKRGCPGLIKKYFRKIVRRLFKK